MEAELPSITDILFVFFASFAATLAVSLTRVQRESSDLSAKQASHSEPTPRIGGLGIVLALVIGTFIWFTGEDSRQSQSLFLAVAMPLFLVGLAEDMGYFSSIKARLVAACFSGVLFVLVFEQWLPRLDIPLVDQMFMHSSFAIPFTIFACVGVTHAFNLIDGLNGLSSFLAIGIAASLMAISFQVGLDAHVEAMLLVIAAVAGFLLVNFPFGKFFLGDGGAYVLGHILVWTAVSIVWNNESVSSFAILLIFFWPIADTVLAIWRRMIKRADITQPDRLHFHQLVMRAIEISALGQGRRELANPLATVAIIPIAVTPMAVGVLFWNNVQITAAAAVFFFAIFFVSYQIGVGWARRSRRPPPPRKQRHKKKT